METTRKMVKQFGVLEIDDFAGVNCPGKFEMKFFFSKCLNRLGIQKFFLEKLCSVTSETLEIDKRSSRHLAGLFYLTFTLYRIPRDLSLKTRNAPGNGFFTINKHPQFLAKL